MGMKARISAAILAVGLLSACAGLRNGASPATVKGYVYGKGCSGGFTCAPKAANGFPISFHPMGDKPAVTVYTDDNGKYLVRLTPGDYKVTLTRAVVKGSQELHLSSGVTVTEDYEVALLSG